MAEPLHPQQVGQAVAVAAQLLQDQTDQAPPVATAELELLQA
jgi:hypothetical protein